MPENTGSSSENEYFFDKTDTAVGNESSCNEISKEREGAHLLSGFQSAMMLFKFAVGVGWFSLPAAFQYSGVVVGIIWVLVCGALVTYGMQLLVETSWEAALRSGKTTAYFGDVGAACGRLLNEKWEGIGRLTVDVFLSIAAFSMLCPIILFVAEIWKQAFEEHNVPEMDGSIWILIVFVILLPTIFIRRPDFLALFSLFANIMEAVMAVSLFVHIFSKTSSWKVDNTVQLPKLPLTIGMIFFAFEIAPFILSVENKIRKPKQLPRVINIVMAVVSLIYVFMGTIGYISCYPECRDSIILNLPNSWYYSVSKMLVGVAVTCSATLICFVGYDTIEPILKVRVPENRFYLVSLLSRTFVLAFACGFTASVPQLANIMSLSGSFVATTVGLILPAVSHTLLLYNQLSRYTIAANIASLCCGVVILIFCVYTSIVEIIEDY